MACRRRRKNAALEELAHVSGADLGGGGVIFFNISMGHRLPRSLGYRSRLGMVFIPIVGGGGAAVIDEINNEALLAKHAHNAGGWHQGQGAQVEGQ